MTQIQAVGPAPARIMIVGEFPSSEDARLNAPFSGAGGRELAAMLKEAGILQSTCFSTYVLRSQPPGGDPASVIAARKSDITPAHSQVRDRMVLRPVWEGLALLEREIELVRPNVIIALGNVALWALTGKWGITSWRGSILTCDLQLALPTPPKVVPTYSPGAVFRQWSIRPIAVQDFRRAAWESKFPEVRRPAYNFRIRPTFDLVTSILAALYDSARGIATPLRLAVDIETRAGHIACIGIAWSAVDALCIPLLCVESPAGYWTVEEEAAILHALYLLLTHRNCHVIGQNFSYDAQYFYRHYHFLPNLVRDTMIAQHVCFSNLPKSLDFLSSMYCGYHVYWKEDGKTWDESTGEEQLWTYNCQDAVITFEVDQVEQSNVDDMKLRQVHDFQQSLFWPVLQTMNRGIRCDYRKRAEFALSLLDDINAREQWLADVLGHPINIRSPKQMQELFYDSLRQKPVLHRKTGNVTCDDEALEKIAIREPILRPVVNKIQELRSLGVFSSTFVNAPLDTDGRLRCSFNIAGTETYRFSSSTNAFGSGLNLQNIPKGSAAEDPEALELPNIRQLLIPDPGYTFFDIDLSSADLRIVVWEADEPEMKQMLREGFDPYTEIAKEFYHDASITKKDPRRQTFKSFAHGTHYLGTAKGLAERLGLPVHQAEKTQAWYFQRFPRIRKWQEDLINQVKTRRMVENIFGYRCYFFDRIEGTVFNQAAAWVPQSTVACLINRAYVNIYKELPWCEVLLQVHDSLAGQFPSHLGEWATKQIVQQSQITLPYADPLIIPVGVKTSTVSWGDCEG